MSKPRRLSIVHSNRHVLVKLLSTSIRNTKQPARLSCSRANCLPLSSADKSCHSSTGRKKTLQGSIQKGGWFGWCLLLETVAHVDRALGHQKRTTLYANCIAKGNNCDRAKATAMGLRRVEFDGQNSVAYESAINSSGSSITKTQCRTQCLAHLFGAS
jgi:hypothetical protein